MLHRNVSSFITMIFIVIVITVVVIVIVIVVIVFVLVVIVIIIVIVELFINRRIRVPLRYLFLLPFLQSCHY